ncbi:MAG: molybdopterin-dependent oxidoreductase [Chloroflexota bacterium]
MTTTSQPTSASGALDSRSADVAAFAAGGLAAALGIAVSEFIAGLLAGAPSLVIAIGDFIIENQPPGGKEIFVDLFGEADKLVLNGMIVTGAIIIAGVLGVGGRRDWNIRVVGFVTAGLAGRIGALLRPWTDQLLAIFTVAASTLAAIGAIRVMLMATNPAWGATEPKVAGEAKAAAVAADDAAAVSESPDPAAEMPDWDRRRFLQIGGRVAVGSVILGVVGRNLLQNRPGGPAIDVELPVAAGPVPSVPPTASLDVPGITPIVVPNDQFYKIDTALVSPRVNVDTWRLTIKGMVDREVTLTYDELSEMPLFEQYVTIACVSNEVGGRLVGNALWTGADLREVLDMAGVRPDATQIASRSVDGWNCGFPTEWAMKPDRKPMIALGMNGSPLPLDHGFPARLIIPGLYGYVSATKWLSEIELTTREDFDGYWIPRGWAKDAPILTQSRIDVPRRGSVVEAGPIAIAGVAWAPDRGVIGVEVRVDEGEWQTAEISEPLNDATWVQWMLAWEGEPGGHRVEVRSIDGTGTVQTEERTRPAPDGARGHHLIDFTVVQA